MPPKMTMRQKLNTLKPKITQRTKKDAQFENNVAKFYQGKKVYKKISHKIKYCHLMQVLNRFNEQSRFQSIDSLQRLVDLRGLKQLSRRVSSDQRVLELLRTEYDTAINNEQLALKIERILLESGEGVIPEQRDEFTKLLQKSSNSILNNINQVEENANRIKYTFPRQLVQTIPPSLRQNSAVFGRILEDILIKSGFSIAQSLDTSMNQIDLNLCDNWITTQQVPQQATDIEILQGILAVVGYSSPEQSIAESNSVQGISLHNVNEVQINQIASNDLRRNSTSIVDNNGNINNQSRIIQVINPEAQIIVVNELAQSIVKSQSKHLQEQKQKHQVTNANNSIKKSEYQRRSQSKSQYLQKMNIKDKDSKQQQQIPQKQTIQDTKIECRYPLRNRIQSQKE